MTKMYSFSITRNGHKAEIYLLPESDSKFKVRYNDSKAVSVKPTLGKSPFTLETSRSRCHFISYAYLSSFNEKLGEFIRVI